MGDADGAPTDRYIRFYRRAARGGAGVMLTGLNYVIPDGQGYLNQCGMHDDAMISRWRRVTDAVHEADGRIVAQISHAGRQTDPRLLEGRKASAPSNVFNLLYLYRTRQLEEDEIKDIIRHFGRAAARAKEAGFDGVQIHSSGGYLLASFLSPMTNRRKDGWGGSREARFRLFAEIYREVRKTVGNDFPVFAKLHLGDIMVAGRPFPANWQAALWMQELGVDALEFAMGVFENSCITFAKGDMPIDMVDDHVGWMLRTYWKLTEWAVKPMSKVSKPYFAKAAKELKKRGLSIPLLLAGGMRRFEEAQGAVEKGTADMIGMARPLLREPGLPQRWGKGDLGESRCISCNRCTIDMGVNANPLKCHQAGA
jgi:2,4-dienoyl-CoA reductase-like NADH-dependent reductase (Old Yellow Enzyme family)